VETTWLFPTNAIGWKRSNARRLESFYQISICTSDLIPHATLYVPREALNDVHNVSRTNPVRYTPSSHWILMRKLLSALHRLNTCRLV
jgi:hypothetical protein